MKVLCVIPARAGSQRIPRKNWQEIDGKSLVMHAYDAAISSGVCDRVVVSSDSPEWPVPEVVNRPAHLSQGEPDSLSRTVQHALKECEQNGAVYDYVVTLQPATPLRTPHLIREMVQKVVKMRARGAITMAVTVPWTWKISGMGAENGWFPGPYPRSQDCNFHAFQEINTVQIGDRAAVSEGKRWGLPLLVTELPSWATLDIDTPEQLDEARRLWRCLHGELSAFSDFRHHLVYSINGQDLGCPHVHGQWTPDDILAEKGILWRIAHLGCGAYLACEIANERNLAAYRILSDELHAAGMRPVPPPLMWSVS